MNITNTPLSPLLTLFKEAVIKKKAERAGDEVKQRTKGQGKLGERAAMFGN